MREKAEMAPTLPKTKLVRKYHKIGQPGYRVSRQKDPDTAQRSLLFELDFPE